MWLCGLGWRAWVGKAESLGAGGEGRSRAVRSWGGECEGKAVRYGGGLGGKGAQI